MASEIRVNKITHTAGVGTITTSADGIVVSGIITATTFSGAVSGTTGTFSGAVSGTTGTFSDDITVTGSNKKFISNSTSSGDYLRVYAGGGTGKWDIYGNGADLRFSDNDSAGVIRFDTDVSITDKIIHTGDTNTAIRFPSADTITTETGGSERLRINSTGEVGIGTVTPDSTGGVGGGGLHIHGPQSDNCRITFTTPTKNHPKPAIGFFGLNRFGMDTWDGLEIRDVTASHATRFKIDENGYRTIPNQPNFLTLTETSTLSANNFNYIVVSATHINVGSCYNGSNGRFTAPIDGYYFFYGMYTGENNISAPVMGFHKNGGSHQGEALNYNATYDGTSMQQVKQLSAGDYVNWSIRDWNNQAPNPWHTWWGGYLLY